MTPPLADYLIVALGNERLAPEVPNQPEFVLLNWRVMSCWNGEEILVGFWNGGATCRVTTPIAHFDPQRREVRTSSGRLYELAGPPASSERELFIIEARLHQCLFDYSDVTALYWREIAAATQ